MSFGLTADKLIIILVIAALLIGPDRLPRYAARLGQLAKSLRALTAQASDRLRDEMGADYEEVDWRALDPRRYDPRRIIREALAEEPASRPLSATTAATPEQREGPTDEPPAKPPQQSATDNRSSGRV